MYGSSVTSGGYSGAYGGYRSRRSGSGSDDEGTSRHYSYEDEDQTATRFSGGNTGNTTPRRSFSAPGSTAKKPDSIDNIASFFGAKGARAGAPIARPKLSVPAPTGATGFQSGQRVRHPKYGEGTIFRREGDGDDAKLTVQFAKFGIKKLVEKFANLERA